MFVVCILGTDFKPMMTQFSDENIDGLVQDYIISIFTAQWRYYSVAFSHQYAPLSHNKRSVNGKIKTVFYWSHITPKKIPKSWIKALSFYYNNTIWWYWFRSLAQVMAYCLMTPNHYLNQWWLLISEVQWHFPKNNFPASSLATLL